MDRMVGRSFSAIEGEEQRDDPSAASDDELQLHPGEGGRSLPTLTLERRDTGCLSTTVKWNPLSLRDLTGSVGGASKALRSSCWYELLPCALGQLFLRSACSGRGSVSAGPPRGR
mmetsp:Transcript_20901/g.40497  ORF Transcript_20901/g.40497 Transcript_20901/m.40497 type:complete len:115 (+) Transcript_20901:700-1044(+)